MGSSCALDRCDRGQGLRTHWATWGFHVEWSVELASHLGSEMGRIVVSVQRAHTSLQPGAVLWFRTPEALFKAKCVSRWRRGGESLGQRAWHVQRPGGRNALQVTTKKIQENEIFCCF